MTEFLAEQLSTAHWFDQRRTRELLHWEPAVSIEEGYERLGYSTATSTAKALLFGVAFGLAPPLSV